MQTNQFFSDLAHARQSVYLTSNTIASTLNAYLESANDDEFCSRIKSKLSKFEDELKVFCCVRDAIILSSFSSSFSNKTKVNEYAEILAENEDDYDLRHLRLSMFHKFSN